MNSENVAPGRFRIPWLRIPFGVSGLIYSQTICSSGSISKNRPLVPSEIRVLPIWETLCVRQNKGKEIPRDALCPDTYSWVYQVRKHHFLW